MRSGNRYDEEKVIITHEAQTRVRVNFVTSYLKSSNAFHTSSAFDFRDSRGEAGGKTKLNVIIPRDD